MGGLFLEFIGVSILRVCKKHFQCTDLLLVLKLVGDLGIGGRHEYPKIKLFVGSGISVCFASSLFGDFDFLAAMAASRLYFFGRR